IFGGVDQLNQAIRDLDISSIYVRFEKKTGNFVLRIERERHVQHAALETHWENHPCRTWFRLVKLLNLAGLSVERFQKCSRLFERQRLAHFFAEQALNAGIIGSVDQLDEAVRDFGV